MLTALQIKNFAIIEAQDIQFGPGLNVISGETGAGKSIVLEAFKLILGGRGGADLIRSGSDALEVSAVFDLGSLTPEQRTQLPDMVQDASELVITRELNQAGRNKIFINGRSGTVTLIKEVAEKLINICGQNQSLRLFENRYHMELIDSYGGYEAVIQRYRDAFNKWFALSDRLSNAETKSRDFVLRRQGLESLIEEISALKLIPGIREELENEVKRLSFAEQLISGVGDLSASFEEEDGLSSQLRRRGGSLQSLVKVDPSLEKIRQVFESGRALVEEAFGELSAYSSGLSLDEEKLKDTESRLGDIIRLEKKYRTDDLGLIKLLEDASRELLQFQDGDNLEALRSEVGAARKDAESAGFELRKEREKAGRKLAKEVEKELAELSMKDARLKIQIAEAPLSGSGTESVEILISTNKGEEFKSIRQVASGGELSRIMLVLKKVLRDKSGVHVLVFDEVDSGISGGVARAVGEKLRALAKEGQVICVTHLAQVASLADRHLLVEKSVGKRTSSVVRELTETDRVEEVARMLAGFEVTENSRASARELLASRT
jgi:DNA repair protein RecN (Recombination protein N)